MGKYRENPRYHIVSVRLSDDEMEHFQKVCGNNTRQEILLHILSESFKKMEVGK